MKQTIDKTKPTINKTYEGMGTCGMTKDMKVKGKLTEIDESSCSGILEDEQHRVYEVNLKTLTEIIE